MIQQLFGLGLHTSLLCAENGESIEEDSTVYELKCNITVEVNHLTEGIKLGLQDDREKNSEELGRLALFAVKFSEDQCPVKLMGTPMPGCLCCIKCRVSKRQTLYSHAETALETCLCRVSAPLASCRPI